MILTSSVNFCNFTVLEKAIVYGCTLDAYCCVQTLIAMGIPGENIQLVEPPAIYQVLFDHVIESLFSKMFLPCNIWIFLL